jgi:hypothetical protein
LADTRTMPTAPRPGAVAMAAMGWSRRASMEGILAVIRVRAGTRDRKGKSGPQAAF